MIKEISKKHIVIVTQSYKASGTMLLADTIRKIGHEAEIALINDINIAKKIESADTVIFRMAPKRFHDYQQLLKQLSESLKRTSLENHIKSFDKLISGKILFAGGVPVPKFLDVAMLRDSDYPVVVKPTIGHQGDSVSLVHDKNELTAAVNLLNAQHRGYIVQEYIAESKGTDKRLFVVGDKVVASMQRKATGGDFRANLHLGAEGTAYHPSTVESDIAINAVAILGLDFAGVDIIDCYRSPLVLEVNPSPGFSIQGITGIDVAASIINKIVI